jgi:hypothetical protein
MCHSKPLGRFEAELTAVVKTERGLLPQLCNVGGLNPERLTKCLNTEHSHQLQPDEFVALISAGHALQHQAIRSLAGRVADAINGKAEESPTSGAWHTAALHAIEALSHVMQAAPDRVKDMTAYEGSTVRAAALKARADVDHLLRELDQR